MRALLLTPDLSEKIANLIAAGCILADICQECEITERSYYHWRKRGRELEAQAIADPDALFDENARLLIAFFQATMRAQGSAKIAAVMAIRSALAGREEVTETNETVTVTRLRKRVRTYIETVNGVPRTVKEVEEFPYQVTTTRKGRQIKQLAPDPAVALEFLARRDPEHWGKRQTLDINATLQAVNDIRAGKLTFESLVEWFDEEEAIRMFEEAGVEPPLALSAGKNE